MISKMMVVELFAYLRLTFYDSNNLKYESSMVMGNEQIEAINILESNALIGGFQNSMMVS